MFTSEIHTLYAYNYWANARILAAAARVTEAQLLAPAPFPNGSLHGTLLHLLSAEWIWRVRLQEHSAPTAMLHAADFPTLAAMTARWQDEEQHMRAFLATLTDEDLGRTVHYANTKGVALSNQLWQLLIHVVLHGMQHRSEAAAILTGYACSPGDIDLVVYLRQ